MFPLLLVFVTVLGYVAHDNPGVRHDLLNTALADFPVVGQELKRNVGALGGNGIALVVGLLALVWGSLGVAQVAQHAMAQVWNVPGARRPGFGARLLRSAARARGARARDRRYGGADHVATLVPAGVAAPVLSTVLVVVAERRRSTGSMFRVLTPGEVATARPLPGRVVGGCRVDRAAGPRVLLVARQLRHTSELYGTFGVVLGLLFFLYLACADHGVRRRGERRAARHLAPRSLAPPPLTDADEQVLADVAETEQRRPEETVDVSFERPRA